MSAPPSRLREFPAPLLDAAVRWLVRRDRGFTAAEAVEFAAWLRADASRAVAVAELERTWDKFATLRELVPVPGGGPDAYAFEPPFAIRGHRRKFRAFAAVAAAAAAVVLAAGLFQRGTGDGRLAHRYATGTTEHKRVMLPDGSKVDLNVETTLDVAFTPTERRVRFVRGDAHFSVAKNPARPFIVTADDVVVRAVGTAFSVRMASAVIEVLVTEGKVSVDDAARGESLVVRPGAVATASRVEPASAPLLVAGERIVIPAAPGRAAVSPTTVPPDEIRRALAGRHRAIELQGTTLAELVLEFNRHGARPLAIDDPELARLRIGGKFRVDEADAFVRLLETTFGVTAERTEERIVLRRK